MTARFAPVQYTLALTFPGNSPGTVTVNGTTYNANTTITVPYGPLTLTEAVPVGTGSTFYTWGGACSGNATSCTISVTGNTSVSATFLQNTYRYTLTASTQSPNYFPFQVTYPPSATTTAECTSAVGGRAELRRLAAGGHGRHARRAPADLHLVPAGVEHPADLDRLRLGVHGPHEVHVHEHVDAPNPSIRRRARRAVSLAIGGGEPASRSKDQPTANVVPCAPGLIATVASLFFMAPSTHKVPPVRSRHRQR